MDILDRYVIEPRSQRYGNRCGHWLVVRDKTTGSYVMNGRAYRRFKDSDEIVAYLRTAPKG